MFFTPFFTLHYVSLGSLLVYLGFVIQTVVMGEKGMLGAMTRPELTELYIIALVLMAMAYWRHRSNIVKLINGTERKTYLFHKPEGHENAE